MARINLHVGALRRLRHTQAHRLFAAVAVGVLLQAVPRAQGADAEAWGAEWLVPESQFRRGVYFETAPAATQRATIGMARHFEGHTRFVLEGSPEPIPYSVAPDGRVNLDVPAGTRVVWAYAVDDEASASPRAEALPPEPGDFATTALGDAWDFEEGDQEGIATWGDRPTEYGEVTVQDGQMTVPITGPDPYFIWGPMFQAPSEANPSLHIDSGQYADLAMAVRVTAAPGQGDLSAWALYVVEEAGRHYRHDFVVACGAWQQIRIDLASVFPDVWDGRIYRALRIDPTDNMAGATVEIRGIRLLPPPLTGRLLGPGVSRTDFEAGKKVRRIQVEAPRTVRAGERLAVQLYTYDGERNPLPNASLRVACVQADAADVRGDGKWTRTSNSHAAVSLIAPRRAGDYRIETCVAIDVEPSARATAILRVLPAEVATYRLVAAQRFVPVSQRQVRIRAEALDAYGNTTEMPSGVELAWRASGGASIRKLSTPGEAELRCGPDPLARHTVEVRDGQGRCGTTEVHTVALKKNALRMNENGYFVETDGWLFLPLGGFYANWPSAMPDAQGRIQRSVDLFPCGPIPYPHGFPWPADVERKVVEFLELCHDNGVTALRLMLRNVDLVGRVDETQLQAVFHMLDLAEPYGIRFNIVLFEDYDKPPYGSEEILDTIVLPHYTETDLSDLPPHRDRFLVQRRMLQRPALRYVDRDAIACQKDYLDALIPRLAPREDIFCYEFENEMVAPPAAWIEEIAAHIRAIDPITPILLSEYPNMWPVPWQRRELSVDLSSHHSYTDGMPGVDHGAYIYAWSKWMAAGGTPFLTGEGGVNQSRWQPEIQDVPDAYAIRGTRDQIWLSLLCGANGAMIWTPMHVGEYGEFANVQPALDALGIDLSTMKRARPALAFVQPLNDETNNAAAVAAYGLLSKGIDFDVVPPEGAGDYPTVWDFATGVLPDPPPQHFIPSDGYQLAVLVSDDASRALLYLRNVAGGIQNLGGDTRPCYLRTPEPAAAQIAFVSEAEWTVIAIYDLDTGQPVEGEAAGGGLAVADRTTHDFAVSLRR